MSTKGPKGSKLNLRQADSTMSHAPQGPKRIRQPDFFSTQHGPRAWWIDDPIEVDRTDPGYLCHVCRHINFEYLLFRCPFKQVTEEIPLDKLNEILQRQECAFCRLIKQTLERFYGIQGVIDIGRDDVHVASMIAAFRSFATAMTEPWQLKIWIKPAPAGPKANPNLLIHYNDNIDRRDIDGTAGNGVLLSSQVNLETAIAWLQRCKLGYGLCRSKIERAPTTLFPRGFKLIDVQKQCIIAADSSHEYLALSYVWGSSTCLQITKGDEEIFKAEGSLIPQSHLIPKTVLDAMALTKKLFQRYLWVDSLCIIQDDPEEKRNQIASMNTIFSNAELVIAGAFGVDADAGLPGVGLVARNVQTIVESVQGLRLSPKLRGFDDAVDQSRWNTRAWTYQERLAAPRTLFMTEQQMFFKCKHYEEPQSEDTIGWGSKRAEGVFPSIDLGTDNFPYEHSINIVTYRHVVEQYSQRQLTRPGDVLDAFAGVGEQLVTVFRSRLLYGLPQTELAYALLWRADGPFSRRIDSGTERPVLPSWSWAGWTGKVRYFSNIHILPCVKFILEDDRIVTSDDLRSPSLGVPSESSHPWWHETWTEHKNDRQSAYYYEHAGNQNAWFAHPIAPMDTRLSQADLIVVTPDHATPVLRFWAETTELHFNNFRPPTNVSSPHWWCPLNGKEHPDHVGGFISIPTPYLPTLGQKPVSLVRIARTQYPEKPEMYRPRSIHSIDQWTLSHPVSDLFNDTQNGIDGQRFDLRKPYCVVELLIIEWLNNGIAQRIGHGQVHVDFWAQEEPKETRIALG